MLWKNIKKCVLDTISDLGGKVDTRARKLWIPHHMIRKMNEQRKWKNINKREGKKNYRRLKKELNRVTDKAKKQYLDSTCDEIIQFQRTGNYDLMYIKMKK